MKKKLTEVRPGEFQVPGFEFYVSGNHANAFVNDGPGLVAVGGWWEGYDLYEVVLRKVAP